MKNHLLFGSFESIPLAPRLKDDPMPMLRRCLCLWCATLLGLLTLTSSVIADAGPPTTGQKVSEAVRVGTLWVATVPVELREAKLRKGTKVRIVHAERDTKGAIRSLSFELPDGHVLNEIAPGVLTRHFAPVQNPTRRKPGKRK